MRIIFSLTVLSLIICYLLASSPVYSAPVMPVSYDMVNGGADSGLGYWDGSYPSPNNKTSYASLTGGLGDLTDGIIANGNFWPTVENAEGTGPYVGWDVKVMGIDPTITFNFSGPVKIDRVSINVDNANFGRVSLPERVDISMGGTVRSFDIPFDNINPAPRWLDFTGLGLKGNSLALTLYDRSYAYDWPGYSAGWVFLSEVTFDSGVPVPEPSLIVLLGISVMSLVGLRRWWRE